MMILHPPVQIQHHNHHLVGSISVPSVQLSKSSLLSVSIGLRQRQLRCVVSETNRRKTTTLRSSVGNGVDLYTENKNALAAELSRTVMELNNVGTLCSLDEECGYPLGIGVRFAVDSQGTPILCFNSNSLPVSSKSSLSVQFRGGAGGGRTPQCTVQGTLHKPQDAILLKKLQSVWIKRFEEEVDENQLYVIDVERVLQIDDFMEEGSWVNPSDYKVANPNPLRDFADKIMDEINTNNMEDVRRFCNVFADLSFQVSEAKVVWVDRLGFEMRIGRKDTSEIYELRIPFPREVSDEKSAKSSFNCLSQLAWEIEKNYALPTFDKVKHLKKISTKAVVAITDRLLLHYSTVQKESVITAPARPAKERQADLESEAT